MAQSFSFSPDYQTRVFRSGDLLNQAFSGAWNSGQFQHCDLDNDGMADMIIYDKSNRKVLTFLAVAENGGYAWKYRPDFEDLIPPLESWLATADYNCDGKMDLFTQTSAGIKVYKNISGSSGPCGFSLAVDGLTSQGFNGQVNIQVNPYGAPAFTDVDGDGDLDILTFDFAGSSVEYHKNRILETTGSCAGFALKKDSCVFGLFATKPACGQIRLNTGCLGQRPGTGGEGEEMESSARIAHIGSQLSALDLDGDGDQDLLVGDLSCNLLNRLVNGGNNQQALITFADTLFPSPAQHIKLNQFPSAYQVDANFDGRKDLVVTPTYFSNYSDGFVNEARSGTLLYLNQGNSNLPDFQLEERDFLQNQSIELGEEAIPVFGDEDGDGDQDLFVGHLGQKNGALLQASVYFFRNTGSAQQAVFELETTDYLGLSSLLVKRIRPVIYDFNGDGAQDFGWVSSPGIINTDSTRLRFLLNGNGLGQAWNFPALNQCKLFPFPFSLYDSPVFVDVDGDGIRDLLVGKYNGRIQYWKCNAAYPNWNFSQINSNYGNIARAPFATNPSLAIADVDLNGKPDLAVGDFTGFIKWYKDFRDQNPAGFIADSSAYYNTEMGIRFPHAWGNFVAPTLADLNGDSYPELAVGTAGGGVNLLINRLGPNGISDVPVRKRRGLYPVPAHSGELLHWHGEKADRIRIFSALGALEAEVPFQHNEIQLPALSPGLYYLEFSSNGRTEVMPLPIFKP